MVGKGSIVFVIGFSIIMGYIMMNLSSLGTRATTNVAWYNTATISKNLANIGANVGLSRLYQNPNMGTGMITEQEFNDGPYAGGRFTVTWDETTRLLRSVSAVRNPMGGVIRDTVEVSLRSIRNNSFSIFAYMTNIEASNIWWIDHDRIYGRLHSNTDLRVAGRPQFYGKVTVSGRFIPPPGQSSGWASNNGVYHHGYETGVARIDLPNDLSELHSAALSGGRYYNEDAIWIELQPAPSGSGDGRAIVRRVTGNINNSGAPNQTHRPLPGTPIDTVYFSDPNFNGVLAGRQRVFVEGTLSGQLTIASIQEDIYIADHLQYQSPIANVFDENLNTYIDVVQGDDMLGLVANRNIRIKTFKKDGSLFMNPRIHASLFSLGNTDYHSPQGGLESHQHIGGFGAQHWRNYGPRGEVYVLGSIVQEARSPVGQFTGNQQIMHGFSKHYMYDNRLADPNVRPPFYPGFWDPTLRIVNWYESIQLPPF